MNKTILFILLSALMILSCQRPEELKVITKDIARQVEPGYALKDEDSTFNYRGKKYYILMKETFDEAGAIKRVSIMSDLEYSTYNKQDFINYKSLIDDYSITKSINLQIISDSSIVINNQKIIPVDLLRIKKEVYYYSNNKDTLYRITYQ